jgi:glycosyltransferase involved in cell wall biosynthesis
MQARISVITATLNRRDYLEQAIASVVAQGLQNVEHVVIDGASSDGTLDLLRKNSHLIWISEPDSGMYEALNKGLKRATGDIICLLNSDDTIPQGAFERVRRALRTIPAPDMVSGAVEMVNLSASGERRARIIDAPRFLQLREQDIGPGITLTNGRYLTRRLVERVGLFDERYKMVSDRDYLLRVLLTKPINVCVPEPLYSYGEHEESLTFSGASAVERLAKEALTASQNGLVEAKSAVERAAYARWHAWALFYWAGFLGLRGNYFQAASSVLGGSRRDPMWILRLPGPVLRHLMERRMRTGRLVMPLN